MSSRRTRPRRAADDQKLSHHRETTPSISAMPYPPRPHLKPLPRFQGTAVTGTRADPELIKFVVSEYQSGRSLRELAVLSDQLLRSHGSQITGSRSVPFGEQLYRLLDRSEEVLAQPAECRAATGTPRQVQRSLSAAERVALAQGLQRGHRHAGASPPIRVHKHTVSKILHDLAIPLRRQSMTAAEQAEAIQLYQQGWSLARLGRHFGRAHTVVRDVLERAGIPRRDSHGRPRP